MRKLNLGEWSNVADIVGMVAVVVSLYFVIDSVDRNTETLQATNDNFLFELQDADLESESTNQELARIIVKWRNEKELTEVEWLQSESHVFRAINRWEITFERMSDGFLSEDAFTPWDRTFALEITASLPVERWEEWRVYYSEEFRDHVDAAYKKHAKNLSE